MRRETVLINVAAFEAARRARFLSGTDVALRSGLTRAAISRVRHGHPILLLTAKKIARAVGVTIKDLEPVFVDRRCSTTGPSEGGAVAQAG